MKLSSIRLARSGERLIRLWMLASVLNRKCGSIWACNMRICACMSCFSLETTLSFSRAMISSTFFCSHSVPKKDRPANTVSPCTTSPSPQPIVAHCAQSRVPVLRLITQRIGMITAYIDAEM